jgi:tetratricopeptide (TPR) repeat protein
MYRIQKVLLTGCLGLIALTFQGCSVGAGIQLGPVGLSGKMGINAQDEASSKVSQLASSAEAKTQQGDYQGAIANLDQVIALMPNEAVVYYNRAEAKRRSGDFKAAIDDLDQALKLQPDEIMIKKAKFVVLSELKSRDKNFQAAMVQLDELVRLDDKDARAYYWRGTLHQHLGNVTDASQDFKKALELQPDFPDAKKALEKISQWQ